MTDWTGVRERVLALAALPGGSKTFETFGGAAHRSILGAPLTAAEVSDAEAWLGVELPADYRAFLLQVGAGGAGPAHGVFPVQRDGSGGWRWIGDNPDGIDPDLLAEPFPGGEDPAAVAEVLSQRPVRSEFDGVADFDDLADLSVAREGWEERLNVMRYDPRLVPGALCLGDEGGGRLVWLVVTGSERGRMWLDPRSDAEDLYPMSGTDGGRLTFADWYLGWLAAAEASLGAQQP